MTAGTIDVPKVGPVNKAAVYGVGGAAALYVGWRWWKARQATASAAAAAAQSTDGSFADAGTLPSVSGAVPADGSFGGTTGGTGSDTTGQILTNSQWSNDALAKLTSTGSYDAGAVAAALGAYLTSQPLTSDQQAIVRAAIGVSGYPPVGTFSIIPGGDTGLSVAPSGLSATNVSTSSASIGFTGVPGATSYQVVVNGVPGATGASSPIPVTGLAQNTPYTVHVVAKTASGKTSPDSPSITFHTQVGPAGAVSGLKVTDRSNSTITLAWNPVPNAKGYRLFVNGHQNGNSVVYTAGAVRYLKANTSYTVGVQALNENNAPGPMATIKASTTR